MRRIGAILVLTALIVALFTGLCFADNGTLTLKDSYPEDGSTGASIENLGVKLYFDGPMTGEKAGKANGDDVFKLYDYTGKETPTRVLYDSKEEGVVLVLLDTNVADTQVYSNSEYTLKISGALVDDNGNQLGRDTQVTFKTLNQKTNSIISMVMMVVMFGGMMIVSTRAAKKSAQEAKKQQEKVNPYKEAKKTGKSVEEIVEKDQKRKAKEAEKSARKAEDEDDEDDYEYYEEDTYKVARRHSASEGGSRYVAKKREAAAKAAAARKKASAGKKKKK